MLDVSRMFESTGLQFKENMYRKAPNYPYMIYRETRENGGADFKNYILNRDFDLELYSEKIDTESEKSIEKMLDDYAFDWTGYPREYLESESHYMKRYEFNFVDKKGE